jgi:predicted lipoprotein with Yx(FWY)xxD motif
MLALLLGLPLVTMSASAQDDTTLMVSQDEALGAILTDATGMTLYLFTPDTNPNESTCYDQCAEAWPILTPEQATALPAGVPGELSTFERTDGTQQVAYNGIPLYYFARDEAAGDVNGEGAGGVWFVVHPGSEHGPYPEAPGEGTPTPASILGVGFTEELGPFLTDAAGMTVYLFTKDTTAGESACYDDCAVNWPPVPAEGELLLPPGIQGTLGSTERTDGITQLTYNDIPLYLWVQDQAPGDTTGQDVGEVWYIVPPGMQHGDEPHHGEEGEEAEHDMGDMATPSS